MVNAWSLAASILSGTFDEDYPMKKDKDVDLSVGAGNTANDGLDYEDMYIDTESGGSVTFHSDLADIDDQYSHHFSFPSYADWTQQAYKDMIMDYKPQRNHQYKYHEEEILKDIEEYVSSTYNGHYTGTKHEYRKVQTIDLMASRDLASDFCQANILKYGSRYGSKDGKNKKDLMKVIHYAMLLLHFDGHYGKPSITSGNIDHNMP